MKDKELKLEEIEASLTLGGAIGFLHMAVVQVCFAKRKSERLDRAL